MYNYQALFKYNKEEIIIDCQRNDLMKDIITDYETKSKLSSKQFSFFYCGNQINPDLSLSQINDKDSEILVEVFPKENKMKKPDYIKCEKSSKPAILEFFNGYWIAL